LQQSTRIASQISRLSLGSAPGEAAASDANSHIDRRTHLGVRADAGKRRELAPRRTSAAR
jgi:hypothetical protein